LTRGEAARRAEIKGRVLKRT